MKNSWRLLYGILIFLAAESIQMITVIILQGVYGVYIGFSLGLNQGKVLSDHIQYNILIQAAMSQDIIYLISVAGVVVCGIIFFFWLRYEAEEEAGDLKSLLKAKNIALLTYMGIGCQFFITGIINFIQKYLGSLYLDYSTQLEKLMNGNIITVVLLLILIAPVTEELVFRGVILHNAEKYVSFWTANLFQAVLFGFYHWNILQGIYAALTGLLLGYICHSFNSVKASIYLHIINNASTLPVTLFPDNVTSYLVFIFTGGCILCIALNQLKKAGAPELCETGKKTASENNLS